MKKQTLLLIASLLTLAACSNDAIPGTNTAQSQIDSIVTARVQQLQVQMETKNDSIINALATAKADSIINAMKAQNTAGKVRGTMPAP